MVVKAKLSRWPSPRIIHWPAYILSLDVKGLVNATHSGVIDHPAAPEILTVHDLPEVFDTARILADEQTRQISRAPTTDFVFHPSVASPQPYNPG